MKNGLRTITMISCLAALVLLAAPAVSADDIPLYSTPDSFWIPYAPVISVDPGYSLVMPATGFVSQPATPSPVVAPVNPVIVIPSLVLDNTAAVTGSYYEGSVSTGSSYSGSGWDWFKQPSSGGMCPGV